MQRAVQLKSIKMTRINDCLHRNLCKKLVRPHAFKCGRYALPAMASSPGGCSGVPSAPEFPPDALADLAVSILGALEGNHFDVSTTLSDAPSTTRAVRAAQGCSVVHQLPGAPLAPDNPFYFGMDAHGYVIVSPRLHKATWPATKGGRCRPIRLTRWLVRAPPGAVVRL